jgi:glycosyltransferase involved in cell wall biosynthesis
MKILFVANTGRNPNKGASGADVATIEALRELGHDVDEVWADANSARRISHGNLHQLLELPHRFADMVANATRKAEYDVIQVNEAAAWLAAKQHVNSGRRGVFINRSHGWEPAGRDAIEKWCGQYMLPGSSVKRALSRGLARLLDRQNAAVLKFANGIIVGSQSDKEWIRRNCPAAETKICVLPLGVHQQLLLPPQVPFTSERSCRILYVGQFHPVKQPEIVGAIASQILAEYPQAHFTWVCEAGSHETARQHLWPEVLPRVQFLDWMDKSSLCQVFDQHGIFLFPSAYESFGMTFLEAMARGLCVVAARVGGVPSIISDQQNGLICDIADQSGFLNASQFLLKNYERARAISESAAQTARLYTWQRTAELAEQFYRSVRQSPAGGDVLAGSANHRLKL